MPFMGKDWRSPGEAWVKTESLGWQRMKIIESQLQPSGRLWCGSHLSSSSSACSWPPESELGQHMARHCCLSLASCSIDSGSDGSTSTGSSRDSSQSPSAGSSPEKQPAPYGQRVLAKSFDRSEGESNLSGADNRSPETVVSRIGGLGLLPPDRPSSAPCENTTPPTNCDLTGQNNHSLTCCCSISNNNNNNNNTGLKCVFHHKLQLDRPISQDDRYHRKCCSNTHHHHHHHQPFIRTAPHCRISVRTREVAMYNTISEAFYRLDFCNAIHDIRRFNYICKLLHLLITQNLTSLSGCATRVLFMLLEQVACEVSANKRNIHVLRNLLNELKQTIHKYYCWGRPIGSSVLWQQHFDTIERIWRIVDTIELSPADEPVATRSNSSSSAHLSRPTVAGPRVTFNDLPVEMVREILLRLNDYRDLISSAEASPLMRSMVDGQYLWQRLCRYHFSEQQLQMALNSPINRRLISAGRQQRAGAQSRRRDHQVQNNRKSVGSGIKYARTVSADGRTSFRKPVVLSRGSSDSSNGQPPTAGHVTRVIRIFDREGAYLTLGASGSSESSGIRQSGRDQAASRSSKTTSQLNGTEAREFVGSRPVGPDGIDWEFVFHQLRKKFDLKEEYADCLLLCRHCRCLFWKSIGHPCVMGDDTQPASCPQTPATTGHAQPTCPSSCGASVLPVSVAELSRNFDHRQQEAENLPSSPQSNAARNVVRSPRLGNPIERPQPLGNWNGNRRPPTEQAQNNTGSRHDARELVPKHVAISPQAFLKFFSL